MCDPVLAADLDVLMHRLAVVNARLSERFCEEATLRQERGELMELIARQRVGQLQHHVWTDKDGIEDA